MTSHQDEPDDGGSQVEQLHSSSSSPRTQLVFPQLSVTITDQSLARFPEPRPSPASEREVCLTAEESAGADSDSEGEQNENSIVSQARSTTPAFPRRNTPYPILLARPALADSVPPGVEHPSASPGQESRPYISTATRDSNQATGPGDLEKGETPSTLTTAKSDWSNRDVHFGDDPLPRKSPTTPSEETADDALNRTSERKLVGRIDRHVLPFLCLMYMLAFLDRVNISNANSFGLSEELGMDAHEGYSIALVIFFIPYIILEIPSNYLLKRLQPNYWLGGCMILFGLTTLAQGLVKNYSGLLACRFFLGVFESGLFPGAFYLIGMWYRRREAQTRYTFFFMSTTLAGAFGGLFASALGMLDGHLDKRGWRWIFLIEGAITTFFGIVCLFFLPTFPEEAPWLSRRELKQVQTRISEDQGQVQPQLHVTFKAALSVICEPKILLGGLMYFALLVPSYSYAYFAPGIIKSDYGFNNIDTQLYSAPPWVVACVFGIAMAIWSDKIRHRFGFVIGLLGLSAVGFIILICVNDERNVQYAALFLVTSGVYSALPIIVCWFNMNLGGHLRRSVGSAWQISFGNIGAIVAAFTFSQDKLKSFQTGYIICLSFLVLETMAAVAYWFLCRRDNIIREGNPQISRGLTEREKAEMGDNSPDYRYLL